MAILIDADILIEAERGRFDLPAWLEAQSPDCGILAAITLAEFRHGIERATGAHRIRRERFFDELIRPIFEILPYTEATAAIHARLWAELESSGQMISPHDLILAATAIQTGNAVATFNRRHFVVVKGLEVIEPS